MISLPIRNASGEQVGTYEFDPSELAPSINKQLLHDVVVMYEANRRVGTVKTKSRGEVRGSTRKLYRQKGTGRARAGARRTPIRRGGGHAFAKRPKDWGYRLPKKAVRLATRMALLSKFLDDEVTLVDKVELDEPKTKVIATMLTALGIDSDTCLLTLERHDPVVWKSSRNLPLLDVLPASDLNAYALLRQKRLLLTTAALDQLRGKTASSQPASTEPSASEVAAPSEDSAEPQEAAPEAAVNEDSADEASLEQRPVEEGSVAEDVQQQPGPESARESSPASGAEPESSNSGQSGRDETSGGDETNKS